MKNNENISEEIDINTIKNKYNTNQNREISEEFIVENMSLIETIVAKVMSSKKMPLEIEHSDLISWGVEGLIKAKKKYQVKKNTRFATYAYYRIKGEIFDRIRKEWKYKNLNSYEEAREKVKNSLENILEKELEYKQDKRDNILKNLAASYLILNSIDDRAESVEVKFEDDYQDLNAHIEQLNDEDKKLIEYFYQKGLKQKEIAKLMKVSESTVCRMHRQILSTLRKRVNKNV